MQTESMSQSPEPLNKTFACRITAKSIAAVAVSAIFLVLLFWGGGPDTGSLRSLNRAWNLGHIVCFFFWTWLLLSSKRLATKPYATQLFWVLVFAAGVGATIEVAQALTPRTSSVDDVLKDVIGAILAFAFFPRPRSISIHIIRTLALLLVLFSLYPLATAIIDEQVAKKQFPVLADFETKFEKERWQSDKSAEITQHLTFSGIKSLLIKLSTRKYSGIHLEYFPGDWQNFRGLHLAAYNPLFTPLKITCRIHDQQHEESPEQLFRDRFNRSFLLNHGWNEIEIPLQEVVTAPQGRQMDLSRIQGFGLFVSNQPKQRTILLDDVRLVR